MTEDELFDLRSEAYDLDNYEVVGEVGEYGLLGERETERGIEALVEIDAGMEPDIDTEEVADEAYQQFIDEEVPDIFHVNIYQETETVEKDQESGFTSKFSSCYIDRASFSRSELEQ